MRIDLRLLLALGAAVIGNISSAGAAETQPAASSEANLKVGPAMAVYRGVNETAKVDAFAAWLGQPVIWAEDTIGSDSWNNVGWPIWWLETWSKWVNAKPGRRFIFAVPMLTGPVDGSGPKQGTVGVGEPVSLEKAATGAYNINYQQLAENLVHYGLGDSILRLGWEFNGDWYAWRAKGKAQAYAEYWRQIVKTMRAVPGAQNLKFCWNPNLGLQQFASEEGWPGDGCVDMIGLDVYDESWLPETYPWPAGASAAQIEARQRKVWEKQTYGGDHGLVFWSKFGRQHNKPLAICEWGVKIWPNRHGGMDDPYFVEQMHRFITDPANNVYFHCYFDFNCEPPDGHHKISPDAPGATNADFPRASAKFKALFGTSN